MLSPRSQQTLFTLPAFRGLGEAERKQVAGFFREIALEKDAIIYRAGDDADALYLLASGAVDVLDGVEMIARYGPGEVFGEAAVFAGERRAVTTRVALDAVLLVLPRDSIDRLLELHPTLHQRVSALMARRLKEALQVATGGRRARAGKIVEDQIAGFTALIPDVRKGDTMSFTWRPGTGLEVALNGAPRGSVPGDDFARALFAVWFGPHPGDENLKRGMLGK